jgi:sucrose-6F-phosphate phosphohydrolase
MPDSLLIATDLDRTLIPNGPQAESPQARPRFRSLAQRAEVTLVYVSGRDTALVRQAIRNYCLPEPDYVIGDVGSSIYRVETCDVWHAFAAWENIIASDWAGKSHDQLAAKLSGIKHLRAQEPTKQAPNKLSYYVPMHAAGQPDLETTIESCLNDLGVRANLIWSIDEPAAIGLLDILPASAGKLHALRYLMQQLGFGIDDTVFCGDSGNDMEILTSDIHSVLVANAMPEVRDSALNSVQASAREQQLYIAQGDFMGMNGYYSAGMLEGIAHFHPHTAAWMQPHDNGSRA